MAAAAIATVAASIMPAVVSAARVATGSIRRVKIDVTIDGPGTWDRSVHPDTGDHDNRKDDEEADEYYDHLLRDRHKAVPKGHIVKLLHSRPLSVSLLTLNEGPGARSASRTKAANGRHPAAPLLSARS